MSGGLTHSLSSTFYVTELIEESDVKNLLKARIFNNCIYFILLFFPSKFVFVFVYIFSFIRVFPNVRRLY